MLRKLLIFMLVLLAGGGLLAFLGISLYSFFSAPEIIEANTVSNSHTENKATAANLKNESTKNNHALKDEKSLKDEKLQRETDTLLVFFDRMPSVPVFIRDEPVLKSGSETQKGVAYTDCQARKNPTIYVKKDFYERTNRKQLVNILKHELTHAWFCRQGIIAGHDARFRKKFADAGGFGN